MPVFLGPWSPADPPQAAGLAINFRTLSPTPAKVDALGVAAIVGESDWGPENVVFEIDSFENAALRYHEGTFLHFAIYSALLGEGSADRTGARKILAYRMVGSGAVNATRNLQNTTPANAITLTAKYKGTRGNSLALTVQANADTTKHDLLVYDGTTLVEKYTYAKTSMAALAALVNASSNYLTAAVLIDGVALGIVTSQALAGGTNGAALVTGDHTTAMAALEARAGEFSALALDVTPTDLTIRGLWRDWTKRVAAEGGLFHWVIGGGAAEAVATAITRSGPLSGSADAMDSEWIVNITRDLIIDGVTYSSSRMAARVAGILVAAGVSRSVTFAHIEGATLSNAPTAAEVELLVRGSVIPLVWSDGAVHLQRGRTTFVTFTVDKNDKWQSLLNVRKIAYSVRRISVVQQRITGADNMGNDGGPMRDAIIGRLNAEVEDLIDEGVLTSGTKIELDTSTGLDNDNETLHLKMTGKPVSGVEQLLATWVIPA